MPEFLAVERARGVARVELARPEVRNAFNAGLIAELTAAFEELNATDDVRAIVLSGRGKLFCGGADVNWMRASLDLSHEANVADARAMSRMFRTIDRSPKATIARVHGAALGGGAGLAAVCDIVYATSESVFGFTEVKLGIIPATISPFVLAKIGASHARALALTGERFGARRAREIGLVHDVFESADELDAAIDRALREIATAAPSAIAETKRVFACVLDTPYDRTLEPTIEAIARQRTSPEGQAGLRAFLEKQPPPWSRA